MFGSGINGAQLKSRGINGAQLKSQLKMCMSRLQVDTNQKRARMKQNMQEIAMLLNEDPPKEEKAKLRAVALIHDDNTVQAYDFLKLECELLVERTKLLQYSKECPSDLISCVSDMIYAAPRVDISELVAIRKQFRAQFGKQFEENAHHNNGEVVSERIVNNLSLIPPSPYSVQNYLMKIAKLYNVAWVPTPLIPEEKDPGLAEAPAIPVNLGVEVVPTKIDEAAGGAITGVEVHEYEKGTSTSNYNGYPTYSPQLDNLSHTNGDKGDSHVVVKSVALPATVPTQDDFEISNEGYSEKEESDIAAHNQSEGDRKIPGELQVSLTPAVSTASSHAAQSTVPLKDDSELTNETYLSKKENSIAYNQNEGDRKIPGIVHAEESKSSWDDIPDDEIHEMIGLDDAISERDEEIAEKESEGIEKNLAAARGDRDNKFKEVAESPKSLSKTPHENGNSPVVAMRNLPASNRDEQKRESEPPLAVGAVRSIPHSYDEIMVQYEEAMNELQAELDGLSTNKSVNDGSVAESEVPSELDKSTEDHINTVNDPIKGSVEATHTENVMDASENDPDNSLEYFAEDPGEISEDEPRVVDAIVANQVPADATTFELGEHIEDRDGDTSGDRMKDSIDDPVGDYLEDPLEGAPEDSFEGPSEYKVENSAWSSAKNAKDSSGKHSALNHAARDSSSTNSANTIAMNPADNLSEDSAEMPAEGRIGGNDGRMEIPRVSPVAPGIRPDNKSLESNVNAIDFRASDNFEGSGNSHYSHNSPNEKENAHPEDSNGAEKPKFPAKNKNATPGQMKGAAIAGGVAGFLVGGSVGSVVGAAGAAHLTTKNGKLAKMARGCGKRVNNTLRHVFEED